MSLAFGIGLALHRTLRPVLLAAFSTNPTDFLPALLPATDVRAKRPPCFLFSNLIIPFCDTFRHGSASCQGGARGWKRQTAIQPNLMRACLRPCPQRQSHRGKPFPHPAPIAMMRSSALVSSQANHLLTIYQSVTTTCRPRDAAPFLANRYGYIAQAASC